MDNHYWFKMQYHVYMRYTDKKGKDVHLFSFNMSKKAVTQEVASNYMKNRPFIFCRKIIRPLDIDEIAIYKSKKKVKELILPNGTPVLDGKNAYIAESFGTRKVKGVSVCTLDIITSLPEEKPRRPSTKPSGKKEKVFIVHGRDETQVLRLQKYLTKKLEIDAQMFEDFKEESSSKTIIEQLEYIKSNVGYAFVIVTPDDLGCLRENIDKCRTTILLGKTRVTVKSVCDILDNLHTRARQNVVFEHGLLIGALGRDRVCCLLKEDTKEKPSDIDGILYVGFKRSVKETFPEITQKLKKVGLIKT